MKWGVYEAVAEELQSPPARGRGLKSLRSMRAGKA